MRSWIRTLVLVPLVGCIYVTKDEYLEYWDADGDGWPVGEDCDDANDQVYPGAADFRGDGCDADCDAEPDADGDDWPDDADCAPDDPTIFPCNPAEVDGDGIDSDCGGPGVDDPDGDGLRDTLCPSVDPDYPDATPLLGASCGG